MGLPTCCHSVIRPVKILSASACCEKVQTEPKSLGTQRFCLVNGMNLQSSAMHCVVTYLAHHELESKFIFIFILIIIIIIVIVVVIVIIIIIIFVI